MFFLNSKGRQLRAGEVVMKIITSFYISCHTVLCGLCPHVLEMTAAPQVSYSLSRKKKEGNINGRCLLFLHLFGMRSLPWVSVFIPLTRTNHMAIPAAREPGYFSLSRLYSRERQRRRRFKQISLNLQCMNMNCT